MDELSNCGEQNPTMIARNREMSEERWTIGQNLIRISRVVRVGSGRYSTEVDAPPPMLAMREITKRFPGTLANDRVDLEIAAGEVHALLGENGAGKTTLMNILYGLYRPDEGALLFDGHEVHFQSPRDAMARGIGLVAQHFHLARRHTVAENIALGLPGVSNLFPTRQIAARIDKFAARYGLSVDPRRQDLAALARRAAAGRDPQGPARRRPAADPRRADQRPHPPGGREPLLGAGTDARRRGKGSSSSATSSMR